MVVVVVVDLVAVVVVVVFVLVYVVLVVRQPQITGQESNPVCSMHIAATAVGSSALGHKELSTRPSGHDGTVKVIVVVAVVVVVV